MVHIKALFLCQVCYFLKIFTSPLQWLHRISHRIGAYNIFNGMQQINIFFNRLFSAATTTPASIASADV